MWIEPVFTTESDPLRYISTRGTAPMLDFEGVLIAGLARDGGLYVPESWPRFSEQTPNWSWSTFPIIQLAMCPCKRTLSHWSNLSATGVHTYCLTRCTAIWKSSLVQRCLRHASFMNERFRCLACQNPLVYRDCELVGWHLKTARR